MFSDSLTSSFYSFLLFNGRTRKNSKKKKVERKKETKNKDTENKKKKERRRRNEATEAIKVEQIAVIVVSLVYS